MSRVEVKEAEAGLAALVDKAAAGAFVTITRQGKPVAVMVSVEAAEVAKREMGKERPSLVAHLKSFPVDVDPDDSAFARNRALSGTIDL